MAPMEALCLASLSRSLPTKTQHFPLGDLSSFRSSFMAETSEQLRTRTVRIRSLDRTDWLEENDGSRFHPACPDGGVHS